MKILNKSAVILLLSCFCVLSISMTFRIDNTNEVVSATSNPTGLEVTFVRPTSTGARDASITVNIKKGSGPFKVIAVSDTPLGTFTIEGGNTIVLDALYAGFYKLYIVDSEKNTTEYQVTID